jgi:hypothetical protein
MMTFLMVEDIFERPGDITEVAESGLDWAWILLLPARGLVVIVLTVCPLS